MSSPGKITVIKNQEGLPYPDLGTNDLLVVSDSSNNRVIILTVQPEFKEVRFLEAIGNGRLGHKDGSFAESEFFHV